MIESGGTLGDLLVAIPQAMFAAGKKALKRYVISTTISTKIS